MIDIANTKNKTFENLYKEYYAPFCIYAKRYIDDSIIRQDIVSEVFTTLCENMNSFDLDSETIIGYIKICVKNRCLNYIKHLNYELAFSEESHINSTIYDNDNDNVYTKEEMYKMLYDALEKLPSNYKKIFVDSYFKGKTREEIASEMNVSVKTAGRYKQKAIELLRNELKDLFLIMLVLNIK